jgi:hypothetical protein
VLRAFSFAYRRFTQERDDPNSTRPATPAQTWHMTGLSYWAGNLRGILRRAAGPSRETFYATDCKKQRDPEARIVLAIMPRP